jgi:hypothetical protein
MVLGEGGSKLTVRPFAFSMEIRERTVQVRTV